MQFQSILRERYPQPGFVYSKVKWDTERRSLLVSLRPRKGSRPVCSGCKRRGSTYDHLPSRHFDFIPVLGVAVSFVYSMRRVDCRRCERVIVERVPWAEGKEQMTTAYKWFLSTWARRLNWTEVATIFHTSWDRVYRAVRDAVFWGLVHRDESERVEAIGVDEIAAHKGHRYLTLIYQIDGRIRRLLWVGKGRSESSLATGLEQLEWALPGVRYVCSDLAPGYLKAIREKLGHAVHVLDRFHVVLKMNKALDEVRADEVRRLKSKGRPPLLTHSRWCLLKQPRNLNAGQASKLKELMRMNLRTIRAYLLKQSFATFWQYRQAAAARRFLKSWTSQAMRSRIVPMKKVAGMLRRHEELLLNWVRARGAISNGITEGLNNKAKVALRKSYGFRTDEVYEVVLYHQLGALPEPDIAHKFC